MNFIVQSVSGKTFNLIADEKEAVIKLKEQIKHTENIPESEQRLIFNRRELINDELIIACNIKPNDKIYLVEKLKI